MTVKILFAVLVALSLALVLRMAVLGRSSKSPPALGFDGGRLAPCPRKPNCVSSHAKGKAHGITPISTPGPTEEAVARAHDALVAMQGCRIVEIDGGYLRAEFTSRLFRFVDDLELLWSSKDQHFDVRSASRVGNSDLGVNRKRVEALRVRLSSPIPED